MINYFILNKTIQRGEHGYDKVKRKTMKFIARLVATGFYSGYFPIAPGTVGSGLALLVLLCFPGLQWLPLLIISVIFFMVGVWSSTIVEKSDGKDASIINIDEIVGMWLSVIFLPEGLSWYWFIIAFFIFRFYDIVKPQPVDWSQSLSKGWGIMIDDVLAGLYTNITLRLLIYLISILKI